MREPQLDGDSPRPTIEWVAGVASAILVVGVAAFLAFEAVFGDGRPPDLAATIEGVERIGNGTLVWTVVANKGDEAAADVGVEALVTRVGESPARKLVRFDYIAARASRRGAFLVEGPSIQANDVQVSIQGFVEP